MYKLIITILLFNITSCSSSNLNIINKLSSLRCSLQPTDILLEENVKELDLEAEQLTTSSQIDTNQSKGYVFKVRAGQKLNYKTNKNTCLWIYSPENYLLNNPENKIVSNLELAQSGTYIIQIATLTSLSNLDLDLNLGLSRKQAVNLLEGWYGAKEKVLGKTVDNSVLNQYTTGDFKVRTNNSVSEISKSKCYYKFNTTTIEDVISFNNIPPRPVLVVNVYEEYERYSTAKLRKCHEEVNSSYQATITYWFEKDNGEWKIHSSELKNNN